MEAKNRLGAITERTSEDGLFKRIRNRRLNYPYSDLTLYRL